MIQNQVETATRLTIRSQDDIRAIEAIPIEQRISRWDVADWLWRGCEIDPDKPAVHAFETGDVESTPQVMTYRQLRHRAVQVANGLSELGVGSGDAVVCLLPNIADFYPITMGAIATGIICPLNWMLSGQQIAALIGAIDPRVVIALGPTPGFDIWEKLDAVRDRMPARTRIMPLAGMRDTARSDQDFDRRLATVAGDRLDARNQHRPDDIVAYIHSGGTTGLPKLVKLTHRGFAYKFWSLSNVLGFDDSDVIFADYPFFHCAGFLNRAVASMALGMTAVIPSAIGARDKQFIRDYWSFVSRFKITQLSGVPTTLSLLAKSQLKGNEDVGSLRPFAMTGSQPMPVDIARQIEGKFGVRMLLTYGATEYTTTLTQTPATAEVRYGSTGLRMPYSQIRIVELDGAGNVQRECRPNEIGVVVAKGPGITPGYLIEQQNAGLFTADGWINSGDLGRLDEDGYLWLTGRAKDLIIRGGHNIEPSTIEEPLQLHPAVLRAAAVGKPDRYAGEVPVAYVQLADGARCTESELRAFVAERINERAAVPVDIHIVDEIPLSDVRKPLKDHLRRDAAQRTFSRLLRDSLATADVQVEIGDDPERGSIAVIRLGGRRDEQAEHTVAELMKGFSIPYVLEWSDRRAPRHRGGDLPLAASDDG